MSLFLGNLSSHIRREDLEHVFMRFGRCNIRLKDGYGFVVYDSPPNAEKALRALQGKNICGELITLTWSNKQPRPFQRFARGSRSYNVQRGRNFARGEDYANRKLSGEDYANRKLSSSGRRDYRRNIMQLKNDGGRLNANETLHGEASYNHDIVKGHTGEQHHSLREDFLDEGGIAERNLLDNDRWGEQVGDLSNDNGVDNGTEFDRYEPYHDYDRRDGDENHQMSYSGGSPNLRDSQEKTGKEQIGGAILNHPVDPKPQKKCYFCGESGHKMRNCPQENASRRKKFTRMDPRRDDGNRGEGGGEVERLGLKSKGRLHLSRDNFLKRGRRSNRKESGSGKHRRLLRSGSSLIAKETHRAQRKDYTGKKRSRRDDGTQKSHHVKKARGSISSPLHSDYTLSRSHSHSKSSKSVCRSSSHSRLRSVSFGTRSLSSSSRTSSTSHHSRSGGFKSSSRSSSPISLSLSVSLGQNLLSSPNKVQTNLKGSFDNGTGPESKKALVEHGQQEAGDAGSENSRLANMTAAVGNENAVASFKAKDDIDRDNPQLRDDYNKLNMFKVLEEAKNPHSQPVEEGAFLTCGLSPKSLRETRELQNSGALVIDDRLAPPEKEDSEVPLRSQIGNSASISPEEICMVLKHYGLELPEENERHVPVDAYFGSARMWPWEIIYYRRLKKGHISTENYARRCAQNREFRIVDKYIRSSSGWGESSQDNS